MGLNFDSNGKYIGWSNLFDYSSLKTLEASEYLPVPTNRRYTFEETGIDISNYVNRIAEAEKNNDSVARISAYAKLLNYLKDLTSTALSYNGIETDGLKKVLELVNMHERTKLPLSLSEGSQKNFISSHILNTILDIRNMVRAYSPIDMDVFRDASKLSPKTAESAQLTLLDPATKFVMQFQNITGKNVIGIAANGEKGSFMWHYYLNDMIEHPEKYSIENGWFEFKTTRIFGRSTPAGPSEITINTLPNVKDVAKWASENSEKIISLITGNLAVDLMISQVLSAATDNAKELILAKVNAGNKLAKMYLFMITLGLNIDDIVKFMTSDVANFIDAITETDVFNNYGISLDDAYEIASGDFSSLIDPDIIELLQSDYPKIEDLGKLIRSGNIPEEIDLSKYSDSPDIVDAINSIQEIKALMNFDPNIEETKLDIAEFKNIMNGANEFSNYARVLGANQGIKTSKGELLKHIQFLLSLTTNAAKAKGIKASKVPVEFLNFDLVAFVDNKEYAPGKFYRDELIKYYNGIKQCINIFDHIDKIAQFNAIFKIESAILLYDLNLSIKTKIYDQIYSILKNIGNTYISENYLTKLVRSIDNNLVVGFFLNENILIPITEGFPVYDKYGRENPANEARLLKLDSLEALATFKRWMESTVIPELKNGNYYNYGLSMAPEALINSLSLLPLKTSANSVVRKIHKKHLASNKFIKGLTKTISNGVPLYKCDLNMLTVENTPFNLVIFSLYVAGLEALLNIKVTENLSLADMFILYNLIINKNNYGAERMTSVLDGLVKSNNSLSFINKFLEFEGNVDYYGEASREPDSDIITVTASVPGKLNITFELNYIDNLATTASNVTTLKGQKDPSVVLLEADGSKTFYVRLNGSYVAKSIYPDLGDTGQERINRNNNLKKDYVLGGYLKSKIDMTLKSFSTLDETTLETIKLLILEQILNIGEHCD